LGSSTAQMAENHVGRLDLFRDPWQIWRIEIKNIRCKFNWKSENKNNKPDACVVGLYIFGTLLILRDILS